MREHTLTHTFTHTRTHTHSAAGSLFSIICSLLFVLAVLRAGVRSARVYSALSTLSTQSCRSCLPLLPEQPASLLVHARTHARNASVCIPDPANVASCTLHTFHPVQWQTRTRTQIHDSSTRRRSETSVVVVVRPESVTFHFVSSLQ